jgi:methylenetetrahydrofolate dehydrogenase (NADP+) / methenyltetrahydrofolate cyclohydrolase
MAIETLRSDELASTITEQAADRFAYFNEIGTMACFTTILVGDNPASVRYIEMKQREGRELGVKMDRLDLPADISQAELERIVTGLNESDVNAVLIQYPLPKGLDYLKAINCMDPKKDVDGLHPSNLGMLFHDPKSFPGLLPCTAMSRCKTLTLQ